MNGEVSKSFWTIKGVWVHVLGERLSKHIESLGVITPCL
jgi:hypothetical protein